MIYVDDESSEYDDCVVVKKGLDIKVLHKVGFKFDGIIYDGTLSKANDNLRIGGVGSWYNPNGITFMADRINFAPTTDNIHCIFTKNKIDITNYSKLVVDCVVTAVYSGNNSCLAVNLSDSLEYDSRLYGSSTSGTGSKEMIVDLSNITGEYYIRIDCNGYKSKRGYVTSIILL